jgi:hypothetical protein
MTTWGAIRLSAGVIVTCLGSVVLLLSIPAAISAATIEASLGRTGVVAQPLGTLAAAPGDRAIVVDDVTVRLLAPDVPPWATMLLDLAGTDTQDIAEGLRYLAGHPLLRTLALMVGFTNLWTMAVFSVFVLYAVAPGPLGLSEIGFGILMTTMAAGSLAASVSVERLERLGIAGIAASDLPASLKVSPSGGGSVRYNVTISALEGQAYTVQGVPLDATDRCGTFQFTSAGVRSADGPLGTAACWQR